MAKAKHAANTRIENHIGDVTISTYPKKIKTVLGIVQYVLIYKSQNNCFVRMTWDEIHAAFTATHPDSWAIQMFPPKDQTINHVHWYHLWMLAKPPEGAINLKSKECQAPLIMAGYPNAKDTAAK